MGGLAFAGDRLPLRRDPVFLSLGLLMLLAHVYLLRTQTIPYWIYWVSMDEGYRLSPGLRLLRGEVLFRDVWAAYPPLSYYLHAVAFEVFGVKISSIRICLTAAQLVTTLLTYAIARKIVNRGFSLFAALLTVVCGVVQLNMGYSGWYVPPLVLGTLLFLFRHVETGPAGRRELFAAGIFAGLAAGMKLRDGILVSVAALVAILVVQLAREPQVGTGRAVRFHPLFLAYLLPAVTVLVLIRGSLTVGYLCVFVAPVLVLSIVLVSRQLLLSRDVRQLSRPLPAQIGAFASGAALVTLPWIAYHAWQVGADELWRGLVTEPLAIADGMVLWLMPVETEHSLVLLGFLSLVLPFSASPKWRGHATIAAGVAVLGSLVLVPALSLRPAGYLILLLPAVNLATTFVLATYRQRVDAQIQRLVVLTLFSTITPLGLYPWTDVNHWLWVIPPVLLTGTWLTSRLHVALAGMHGALRGLTAAVLVVFLLLVWPAALNPFATKEPVVRLRNSASGDVPFDDWSARLVQPVVDEIEKSVPPDACMLEIPSSFFTFLTGRRQAARMDYLAGFHRPSWNARRELEFIERNHPLYVVERVDGDFWDWRASYPELDGYVRASFEPRRRLGPVQIWKRKGTP